jgi:cytochrome c-type biogenesis protein CcmH
VAAAVLTVLAALALAVPTTAAPRTSFTDVEDEVMCTVCGIPLNLAPSDAPFAVRQREFIRGQIAAGRSKQQIKDALATEYGDEVLALPKDDGFNLAVYLVPAALVLGALALLAAMLPRWRRRARAPAPAAPEMSAADRRRLDEDLTRYDV